MSTDLRWRTSLSATCMHAAVCRRNGISPVESEFGAIVDGSTDELINAIKAAGWPVDEALWELAAFSADVDRNDALVEQTARKLIGAEAPARHGVSTIVAAVGEVEAAMARAMPRLNEELGARMRPIREQWEARGPGLLRTIARLTEEAVVPENAEVVLVGPYAGGYGLVHLRTNRVLLEALLFNPVQELPETLRLGWMVSQLNGDLPRFAEAAPGPRLGELIGLAMIPPVLAAAEEVELARCGESEIARAIEVWRLPCEQISDAASRLWQWWSAYAERPARWPVALAALRHMLLG